MRNISASFFDKKAAVECGWRKSWGAFVVDGLVGGDDPPFLVSFFDWQETLVDDLNHSLPTVECFLFSDLVHDRQEDCIGQTDSQSTPERFALGLV